MYTVTLMQDCSNSMVIMLITPPPIDEEGRERFARLVQCRLLNSLSHACSSNSILLLIKSELNKEKYIIVISILFM